MNFGCIFVCVLKDGDWLGARPFKNHLPMAKLVSKTYKSHVKTGLCLSLGTRRSVFMCETKLCSETQHPP